MKEILSTLNDAQKDAAMCIDGPVLILAGAFCLVALGVLFIRTSTAIKQTGDTVEMAHDTLKRVDKVLDDVNYKLDLLNAPVETVAKFFDPQRPKFNPLKMMMSFIKKK